MTTTGPAIANSLQALPSKASALAASGPDVGQEGFAGSLEQALEQVTPPAAARTRRPEPKPASPLTSMAAQPAAAMGEGQNAQVLAAIMGAEPNAELAQPGAPGALASASAGPSVTPAWSSAPSAGPEVPQLQPEIQKPAPLLTGAGATHPGQNTPINRPDPSDRAQDPAAIATSGQTQIGHTQEGPEPPLAAANMPHHEQQALIGALKHLESAKAMLDGARPAPLGSETQSPLVANPLTASQATAAAPQSASAVVRLESASATPAHVEQKGILVSSPAETLGALTATQEPAGTFDVTLFSADTPTPHMLEPTALPALASLLIRRLEGGGGQISVRLDPPELGRLDVTLGFDDDGAVTAHIRADRPEALELMQREAKGLEQSLRQAGFTLDSSALSFSLNQGSRGQGGGTSAMPEQYRKTGRFLGVEPDGPVQHLEIHLQSNRALDLRV